MIPPGPGARRMWRSVLSALVVLWAQSAAAQGAACLARVDGQDVVVSPGAILEDPDIGLRERLFGWPRRAWNAAWGTPTACDSAVLIAFLAGLEGLSEADAAHLCLAPLPGDAGYLLVPGARNYRGLCATTLCDRINMTAADTAAVAATVLDFVDRPAGPVTGTARGSGALLLHGSNLALSGVIDGASAELGAVLATPYGIATLLAVGGTLYYCGD